MHNNDPSSQKPDQLVILCHSKNQLLLRNLTKTPKHIIFSNGKPFLWYLMDKVCEQSIKKFGWIIDYSFGPLDWDTGVRLFPVKNNEKIFKV